MSSVEGKPENLETETLMTVPADANADMDHLKDTDRQDTIRQQFDKETKEASWQKYASQEALEEIETLIKTVKPAYKGIWLQNDHDIIHRLNEVAEKMRDKHAEKKQDISE